MNDRTQGALLDNRLDEQKAQDFDAKELLPTSVKLNWDKQVKDLKRVPRVRNQNGSGQCVAFSKATQLSNEINRLTGEWLDFSPLSIYMHRVNKGSEGMWVYDALDVIKKRGATLEPLLKSENLTEQQANSARLTKTAEAYAKALTEVDLSYIYLPINIDSIATALELGHAVGIILYAIGSEYTTTPFVSKDLTWQTATIRHSVTALDYFNYNGKKALWIVDSWGLGHGEGGYRILTEDFVHARVTTADYFDKFILDSTPHAKFTFLKDLQFGMRDLEVSKLQDFLKLEGFFPINQDSTGFYGVVTARAVLQWQLANKVDSDVNLIRLNGYYFGPKSRDYANR